MKALTLREPWASAVVFGTKRVENRTWQPPADVLGEFIAIHVAKTYGPGERENSYHLDLEGLLPSNLASGGELLAKPPTLGCIIGLAQVVAVIPQLGLDEDAYITEQYDGKPRMVELAPWYISGCYGWVLDNVASFPRPVPVRGMLGCWSVPESVEDELAAQTPTLRTDCCGAEYLAAGVLGSTRYYVCSACGVAV